MPVGGRERHDPLVLSAMSVGSVFNGAVDRRGSLFDTDVLQIDSAQRRLILIKERSDENTSNAADRTYRFGTIQRPLRPRGFVCLWHCDDGCRGSSITLAAVNRGAAFHRGVPAHRGDAALRDRRSSVADR